MAPRSDRRDNSPWHITGRLARHPSYGTSDRASHRISDVRPCRAPSQRHPEGCLVARGHELQAATIVSGMHLIRRRNPWDSRPIRTQIHSGGFMGGRRPRSKPRGTHHKDADAGKKNDRLRGPNRAHRALDQTDRKRRREGTEAVAVRSMGHGTPTTIIWPSGNPPGRVQHVSDRGRFDAITHERAPRTRPCRTWHLSAASSAPVDRPLASWKAFLSRFRVSPSLCRVAA